MLMLKQLRAKAGLSVKALSDLSGISRRTIEDIEARGDCRISTAYALCEALGVTLNDFYKKETGE
jgi:DNA-binding XRE family transcriptional regulator